MPLPNASVIPAGWSAHHAPVAAGGMNATVTIGSRGEPQYDPDTDATTTPWTEDYTGPARIQALNDARRTDVAGEQVSGRAYLVQILFNAARITPGMRVHVTAASNDPHLAGEDLWVVDPQLGSERFTRDLVCSDNQADVPQEA